MASPIRANAAAKAVLGVFCLALVAGCATSDKGERGDTTQFDFAVTRLKNAPLIDGRIEPEEYAGALSFTITGTDPGEAPGISLLTGDRLPPEDVSYRVHLGHDGSALFVAVAVRDDSLVSPPSAGFFRDDPRLFFGDGVLLLIDSDLDSTRRFEAFERADGNMEADAAEGLAVAFRIPHPEDPVIPPDGRGVDVFGRRTGPQLYHVEFRVPFSLLDTLDGPESRNLRTGDVVGFNLIVFDEDATETVQEALAWVAGRTGENWAEGPYEWVRLWISTAPYMDARDRPRTNPGDERFSVQ